MLIQIHKYEEYYIRKIADLLHVSHADYIRPKLKAEKYFEDAFPKIITVARLDKRKGHDKILMLIKNLKIKFPKIKYISIGDGNEEKNLFELSKKLNLDKEVIFLKNIEFDLKIALIAESNLFICRFLYYN